MTRGGIVKSASMRGGVPLGVPLGVPNDIVDTGALVASASSSSSSTAIGNRTTSSASNASDDTPGGDAKKRRRRVAHAAAQASGDPRLHVEVRVAPAPSGQGAIVVAARDATPGGVSLAKDVMITPTTTIDELIASLLAKCHVADDKTFNYALVLVRKVQRHRRLVVFF